jgi:predicted acyl esterase
MTTMNGIETVRAPVVVQCLSAHRRMIGSMSPGWNVMNKVETAWKSEVRDGMQIDWDVPIRLDDGIVLRADVFRPLGDKPHPVILTYGAFGKGLAFQEGNKSAWERMIAAFPEVAEGSSCKYQVWELVDPEKWVPDGYVCLRIDSRGAGRSPGFMDPWSPRETKDVYDCIEWAAVQPWCNGKVGMNGISYFATNQWQVAQHKPPHLVAICTWEGCADWYREFTRHGGIYCGFLDNIFPRAFHRAQYGLGERGLRSRVTGELVSGPQTLSDEELKKNRIDIEQFILDHPFDDAACRERTPDFSKIDLPVLTAANLGRSGPASARQFRGFPRRCLKAEVAGGAWRRTLDALLHQLRREPAEALLRPFPQGRRQWVA